MNRSLILVVVVVLAGTVTAEAYNLPVGVSAGNITVGCRRTPNAAPGYDEVDFYLTGITGSGGGPGTQIRIDIIAGRWSAGSTGAFWLASNSPDTIQFESKTTSLYWQMPTYSTINFDAYVTASTVWTNQTPDPGKGLPNGGGRGPQTSGNLYNFFSGSWYTTDGDADIVYPYLRDASGNPLPYQGLGTDSTYLAALYVTSATPDVGIGFDGWFDMGGSMSGIVHFSTVPEPGTLQLVVMAASAGLVLVRRFARRGRS